HGKVAVEVAVERLGRDVSALLALRERLVQPLLGAASLRFRPDPRDEDDAFPVRHPPEFADAGAEIGLPPRLAAADIDHVELRFLVLAAFLLALGDEGDAIALRRPRGLRVLLAGTREAPWRARACWEQPKARAALVLLHRIGREGADRRGPVGRDADVRGALDLPERLDVDGFWLGHVTAHLPAAAT